MWEWDFLTAAPESAAAYREWMIRAIEVLCRSLPAGPYSGKNAAALRSLFNDEICPNNACSVDAVWDGVGRVISESVMVTHPNAAAHLHCPPLIPALAAEAVLSALNQSMDSFDQSPGATIIEEKVVSWLCQEAGLPPESGGVFTAGGSQSNYIALLLARDGWLDRRLHWSAQSQGLPTQARKLRILCSDVAHFTVEKSAAQLGLGTEAVVRVESDRGFRMSFKALRDSLHGLRTQGLFPMAIVATAGTTDFGSIDPLAETAELAHASGAWFHVDAAYGSALLFSQSHREKLVGIERADSISMDFHKLLWQPIGCAAVLLRDATQFRYLEMHADYLNPETDEELGIPNLVNRSVATTRRFDALKLWVSLQALGRKKVGEMIDATMALAAYAAECIRKNSMLELIHEPTLGCVVFRYRPINSAADSSGLNADLRQKLFEGGLAVIGHTVVRGEQWLKLTCMNPGTSKAQIADLLEMVVDQGRRLER